MAYYDEKNGGYKGSRGGRKSERRDDYGSSYGRSSYGRSEYSDYGGYDDGYGGYAGERGGYGDQYERGGDFERGDGKKRSFFGRGIFSSAKTNISSVVIYNPRNLQDVEKIIDCLKRQEQVIVDFAGIEAALAEKVLNMLSGAIYALSGSMKRLKDAMFLFTPAGISISMGSAGDRR